MFFLSAGALVWAAGNGSAPRLLPYRGHVDLDGTPLSGAIPMTFTLFDDAAAGVELFNEAITVDVASGDFAVMLGEAGGLPDSALTAAELFVAVSVNGTPLTGRQRIGAATRVMDNPGTFTVGELNATAVDTATLNASSSVTSPSVNATNVTATAAVQGATVNATNAVTTASLVLNGAGGINGGLRGMQSGVIGLCDGVTGPSQAATQTFDTAFDTVPIVMLTVGVLDDAGCTSARIRGIDASSFQWRSYAGTTPFACDCIHWVAFVQN